MDRFLKLLDNNLICTHYILHPEKHQCIIYAESSNHSVTCPYCSTSSTKVHSRYQREIQDLPIQDMQVVLLLNTRKMFCQNPNCKHKTFAERFDFVDSKAQKTNRLVSHILDTSLKLSSVSASSLLKKHCIKISKSSLCNLVKKNT